MKQKQDAGTDNLLMSVFTLGIIVGGVFVIGLGLLSKYLFNY